jgi:hypothetical protein
MSQPDHKTLFSGAVPVFMKSFGRRNLDKTFYVIWREQAQAGMFSNVFHVLAHLRYAFDLGLTPVVDMRHFPVVYSENESVNGTRNAWEYYFHQPSGQELSEVYHSKRVIFSHGSKAAAFGVYYDFPGARRIAAKFLRIREDILDEAALRQNELFAGQSVLGAHFRGQEMKRASGHPVPPSEEQMLERSRHMLDTYDIDRIFVLSEEQGYVDLFKREFGERVVASPSFRTYGENAYTLESPPRPLHMYLLGREALIDTLLLSRADYLLAGGMGGLAFGSGVSMMAQMLNNGAYKATELIYNGINPAGPGQMAYHEFVQGYFKNGWYCPAG